MNDTTCPQNGLPGVTDEERKRVFKEKVLGVQGANQTFDGAMDYYKGWAVDYEQDNAIIGYIGPELVATNLAKLGLPKDARIIDVAAGTGLGAEILRDRYGFTNLDALDASKEMLDISRAKNIYKNLYCLPIGDGHHTPFEDDTYDAAVMAGALAEGHIKCDCFTELIRIVKPGGYILNCMREENRRTVEEYKKLDGVVEGLEKSGAWKKVLEEITPGYYMDKDALTWVFQVTKSK